MKLSPVHGARRFDRSGWLVLFAALMSYSGMAHAQLIVAHRGASYDAPENTQAAFRLAWEQGADAIEGDFYLTQDGRIACIHDADTKRVTGDQVAWKVIETTWDRLRTLDVGRWKGEAFAGERIPSLADVLALVPPDRKFYLEIKGGPEWVEPIARVLSVGPLKPEQIVIIAFNAQTVARVRELLPEVKAYWLVGYKKDDKTGVWTPTIDEILPTLARIRAHGLSTQANAEVVNEAFVQRLRAAGYELHVWTIDEADAARRFRDLGADSITTNRPAFIREALKP